MADALEINARRLEAYERGRVPLPYLFASKFGRRFRINPVWLADGTEILYIKGRDFPDAESESDIHPKTLFSDGYNEFIKPRFFGKSPSGHSKYANEKKDFQPSLESVGQLGLDIYLSFKDSHGVKREISSLADLMNAIRKRTAERGQKAALARELNVSRQAVDQWLAGNAKPSAETTFALLTWVKRPIVK